MKAIDKLMKTLAVLTVCLALNGCDVFKRYDSGFIAPEVVALCPDLQTLPEHGVSLAQAENLWKRDRLDYTKCQTSKTELVQTLKERGVLK